MTNIEGRAFVKTPHHVPSLLQIRNSCLQLWQTLSGASGQTSSQLLGGMLSEFALACYAASIAIAELLEEQFDRPTLLASRTPSSINTSIQLQGNDPAILELCLRQATELVALGKRHLNAANPNAATRTVMLVHLNRMRHFRRRLKAMASVLNRSAVPE